MRTIRVAFTLSAAAALSLGAAACAANGYLSGDGGLGESELDDSGSGSELGDSSSASSGANAARMDAASDGHAPVEGGATPDGSAAPDGGAMPDGEATPDGGDAAPSYDGGTSDAAVDAGPEAGPDGSIHDAAPDVNGPVPEAGPDGSIHDAGPDGSIRDAAPDVNGPVPDAAPDGPSCTDACTDGLTECGAGVVETCERPPGGCAQWVTSTTCGAHQSCTTSGGGAACTCNVDPVCSSAAATCSNPSTLATCLQDTENGQTCFYASPTTTPCTNGACYEGACCTNACTSGTSACLATSSTEIGNCAAGTNGCTAQTAAACGADLVCERSGGAACVDPNWAEWLVPNPQVDVTNGAPNLESYTDNGDGTVTDDVTSLVWQQTASGPYEQAAAATYCAGLDVSGFTDWRLPTIVELMSLVDPGEYMPALNTTFFQLTGYAGGIYQLWTSSPVAGSPNDQWTVSITWGLTGDANVTSSGYVFCVR